MVDGKFAARLNYSLGNEDWRTERRALQIKPTDSVICVTASGDRPLNLLTEDCKSLTSVDSNPVQNELLRLKCAAIQSLSYDDYLTFLGVMPSEDREMFYEKVSHHLSFDSITFWNDHKKKIRKGILYQGRVERVTKVVSTIANILMPNRIKKIFEVEDLEEQRELIKDEWDSLFIKKVMDIALSRKVMSFFSIDPGLYAHIPAEMELGTYIYDRMHQCLYNCLAKESLLFSLIFRGYVEQCGLPLYLQAEAFQTLKDRLSRLNIETEDLVDHLGRIPANSYDCISLSDVASYMDKENFNKMIAHTYHAAKPGARFCIRQFSSDHKIPEQYVAAFQRNTDLEEELEQTDNCFVYRFMVGTIEK